jgi:HPt (histidine-containing phosphotransfer) domain-containing protein
MPDDGRFAPQALALLERLGRGVLLPKLVRMFHVSSGERLERGRSALSAGDAAGLSGAFHSLKASAGQLGLRRVQELGDAIEQQAESADLHDVPALIDETEREVQLGLVWLNAHLANRKAET